MESPGLPALVAGVIDDAGASSTEIVTGQMYIVWVGGCMRQRKRQIDEGNERWIDQWMDGWMNGGWMWMNGYEWMDL